MSRSKPVIGAVDLCGKSVFLNVDHFHNQGETLHADSIYVEPGGKAYNQAVAARRLGTDVLFFGAVGRDDDGCYCRDYLVNEGITPVLQTISDHNTAYACILTDKTGENRVTVYRGASDGLSAGFIYENESEIAKCNVMLLGLECPVEATRAALDICKRHGIYTILNPAPAIPLNIEFLREFDLITPNLQEATVLLGLEKCPSPHELAGLLREVGLLNAVVTLGSDGSLMLDRDKALLFPALKVKAVDTTGAGDTFNAALAVRLGSGHSLCSAVEYATNASAYSVSRPHVMDSLPWASDLIRVYEHITPVVL